MNIFIKLFTYLFLFLVGMPNAFSQTVTFFHNDVSGSPLLATDTNGGVVWKENYRPFGTKINNLVASAGNKIGFHGKPFDNDSGLSQMGARYYNPYLGRFMGVDPKGFDPENHLSFNSYAFANNNPYRYVDPDGHSPIDVVFLAYDIGKLGVALYTGVGVSSAVADLAASAVGVVSPIPGTGQAIKAARAIDRTVDTVRAAENVGDVAKKVPNPGGRLGSDATKEHVEQVADALIDQGWTITGGGNKVGEEYLQGEGGGTKGSAYPDITATKDGETIRINTIDTLKDGKTPSRRELRNYLRIKKLTGGDVILIPKPKPIRED